MANESGVYFGLKVVNAQLVRQGLENFTGAIPQIGRQRIYRAMQRVYKRLGIYPAQSRKMRYAQSGKFMSNRYDRTYQLRGARQLVAIDGGYAVINDPVSPYGVHYGAYVRGDAGGKGQAYNTSDWLPLATILDLEIESLPDEVYNALEQELAKDQDEANSGSDK